MTDIALIFPGQGAQFVGMGKEFYQNSPEAKEIFEKAETRFPGLKQVIFEGPAEKLKTTAYCQPAIFTCSQAALAAFRAHPKFQEMNPRFTAGLSLGEYSALCASGALSFDDTLNLIERRSFHMEEAANLQEGTMAAVIGMAKEKVVALCQEAGAEVANFNSPEQIVITGSVAAVRQAGELIKNNGAKRVLPLDVSGAFHSSLMHPAEKSFIEDLSGVDMEDPSIPLLSNVDAMPTTNTDHIRRNLAEQITSSVQWVDTVRYIAGEGVTTFVEIGPGSVLKGLIRKIDSSLTVYTIGKPEDIEALS